MDAKCPGQDWRFIKPEKVVEVTCISCGEGVELWPDEMARHCPQCRQLVANPNFDLGCIEWCAQSEECLARMNRSKNETTAPLRKEIHRILKQIPGISKQEVKHAEEVLQIAELIGRKEKVDPIILIPAALLHEVEKRGNTSSAYKHNADIPIYTNSIKIIDEIIQKLNFPSKKAKAVIHAIESYRKRTSCEDVHSKILADAHLILSLKTLPLQEAYQELEKKALTKTGCTVGKKWLI